MIPAKIRWSWRAAAIALMLGCNLGASAQAGRISAPDPAVASVVIAALGAAQSGNIAALQSHYLPDCTFVDEFAPFFWTGRGAQNAYFASDARMARETGTIDVKIAYGAPSYSYAAGGSAYVVMPLTVTSTVHGKPYRATGSLAFTLRKTSTGWKIASQTWAKTTETFNPYR